MVNYKKTGKYVQTPEQEPKDIYVGVPEQVDYSGKSSRIDDNFNYIASHIDGPEQYHAGTGISLTSSNPSADDPILDTFSLDTAFVNNIIATAIGGKQNTLTAGDNIQIVNNIISVINLDQAIADYPIATTTDKGFMSAADKQKLDDIELEANKYTLPVAASNVLGGIKIGSNLTITNDGVLNATDTTYALVTPSYGGDDGTPGLMSSTDKEKLDSIQPSANYVYIDPNDHRDGTLHFGNNYEKVYAHPTYSIINGTIGSGKLINGINVDELGHVTGISTTNESGINITNTGSGNVIVNTTYTGNTRTLDFTKSYLGNIQIGVLDDSTDSVLIANNDSLKTVIRKLQNSIASNKSYTDIELDKRLEFMGNASSEPVTATEGDVYKVTANFTLTSGSSVVPGDLLIRHNSAWYVIPSGEKSDTWRPIIVGNEEILPNTAGSGPLRLISTGITNLNWESSTNTLYIDTNGVGPGGSGGRVYKGGTGLSETTTAETDSDTGVTTYKTTFDLEPATATYLGGIKIGNGLSVDLEGKVNVTPVGYDATNGIDIINGVIQPHYGKITNTIAEGNHTHDVASLFNLDPHYMNDGDVLTFSNNTWQALPVPRTIYTAGSHITLVEEGENTYSINSTDANTNRGVLVNNLSVLSNSDFDQVNLIAGDGITISTGSSITDVLDITISSTNCSGGGGGSEASYSYAAPIYINNNNVISLNKDSSLKLTGDQLGLKYLSSVFTVDSSDGLKLKYDSATLGVNSTGLYVKGSITDTNTWRNIDITDNHGTTTSVVQLDTDITSGKLNLVPGTNVTFTTSSTNGVTTLEISASGGGASYNAGTGIEIDGYNYISTKIAASTSSTGSGLYADSNGLTIVLDNSTHDNLLELRPGGLYCPPDEDIEYTAGTGLQRTTVSGDEEFSVKLKQTSGLTADSNGLAVNVDNNTIRINSNNNQLYLYDTSTLVPATGAITDSSYTLNSSNKLANNTIYRLNGVNTLTISSLATDFSYATICWYTGSSPSITVSIAGVTTGFVGQDCSGGTFTPAAGKNYQIAVDIISGSLTFYVLKLS